MRGPAVLVLLIGLLAPGAVAGDMPDIHRLFPRERDVLIDRDGLTRIPLPADVLAACRADLSDLRLFDTQEREIPYLVDAGPPPGSEVTLVRSATAEIVDVRREERRREDGPPTHRETYVLRTPQARDVEWQLVFDVGERRFVRRLETKTDEGMVMPVDTSIFRLPELSAEKTRVTLPSPLPERIVLTLEGEEGGYLSPRLRFETSGPVGRAPDYVAVPLEQVAWRTESRRTVLTLARPAGIVPETLELETGTSSFNRAVAVWDEAPDRAAELLARVRVFRVPAAARVEERQIPVRPARGARLRVEIDDGDSPPLEAVTVGASVRQPVVVAALHGPDAPAARLRFGGGRAHAPRYDLAAFLPAAGTLTGPRATAAARLYDPAETALARLGEPRDNPEYDRTPALAFAMRAGALVDDRVWTHRRALAVHASPEGLTRVRLSAADLALARPDLADVRIVDEHSRQWPYLLDREHAEAWAPVVVGEATRRGGVSIYALRPAVAPIIATALALDSTLPFFDRGVSVVGRRADDTEVTLAAGRLSRRQGDSSPVTLPLRAERVATLELRVEDGNDAPIVFNAARVATREHDLYLAAPEGTYALLLGNEDVKPPSYELERVRDMIGVVGSGTAEPAELGPNPTYSARARLAGDERLGRTVPTVVLWVVLIGAVAVLTAVTLRLARRGESAGGTSDSA